MLGFKEHNDMDKRKGIIKCIKMKWHNEMHNRTNAAICKGESCNMIHIFKECNEMHK